MADNNNQNSLNRQYTPIPSKNEGGSGSVGSQGVSYIHMPQPPNQNGDNFIIKPIGEQGMGVNANGQGNVASPTIIATGIETVVFPEGTIYVIADYDGEDASLNVAQSKNKCKCADHDYIEVNHTCRDTGNTVKEKLPIKGNNFRIYYYDLNRRARDLALASGVVMSTIDPMAVPMSAVGGAITGGIIDFCIALRFFGLPIITPYDTDFLYFTNIKFHSCPNSPVPQDIFIVSYPDISFAIEVGYSSSSETSEVTDRRKSAEISQKRKWFGKFNIKYGGVTKELSFEHTIKSDKNEKLKKGSFLYNEIHGLADDLKRLSEFSRQLKEGTKNNNKFSKSLKKESLVEGELSFEPKLKLQWKYATSDDNTKIGKNFGLSLSFKVEGMLKVDILRSLVTGLLPGIGTSILEVIDFLKMAAEWIASRSNSKEFEADIFFDLIITSSITVSIDANYNTVANKKLTVSSPKVVIPIEFEVKVGFEFMTTICIQVDVKGSAGCKFGITNTFDFVYNDDLFLRYKFKTDGFDLYVDASAAASYSKKSKTKSNGKDATETYKAKGGLKYKNNWTFCEKELNPVYHNITGERKYSEVTNVQQQGARISREGHGGGGGGGL
ncbi:MAG: hypothetical protein J6Y98_05180 [Bacteroidales bacterium]|nr:hypothetical protein [Bacteroidales bacterium]